MLDLLLLGAVDLARLHALEKLDGLGDAVLELRDRGLVVGELRQLLAGGPAGAVDGVIGRGADLPQQREHVGRQPHAQQILLLDLAGRGPAPPPCRARADRPLRCCMKTGTDTEYMETGME